MPRTADHHARREQMASAAFELAAGEGLDAVSVARVAAAAGVSVGLVQHYFPSKSQLIQQTYRWALGLAFARVETVVEQGERVGQTIAAMMETALRELLPLDDQRTAECRVREQFLGRAAADPELGVIAEDGRRQIQSAIATAIDNGRLCGETDASVDTQIATWELWSLTSGLAVALLGNATPPVDTLLGVAMTRIFAHPCQDPQA